MQEIRILFTIEIFFAIKINYSQNFNMSFNIIKMKKAICQIASQFLIVILLRVSLVEFVFEDRKIISALILEDVVYKFRQNHIST